MTGRLLPSVSININVNTRLLRLHALYVKCDAACLVLMVMTYIKCEQGVQKVFVKNCVGKKLLVVGLSI